MEPAFAFISVIGYISMKEAAKASIDRLRPKPERKMAWTY
jgi:hypothetical protein